MNIVWASCVGRTFPKPSIGGQGTDIIVGPAKADVRDQSPKGRRSLLEIARSIGAK